tara:strand:+ start:562 stop:1275 length:714 start_codon:yes stop_codon:yes gene_type:complete
MVKVIIDSRESKLKEILMGEADFEFQNLDIGDIIFKKDDKTILVVERKTESDLYSSIRDGRYKEQKLRLTSSYSLNQILYLIEESKNKFKINESIVKGAIINMTFRDNIKIIFSKNLIETSEYIRMLKKKIEKTPEFFIKIQEEKSETSYLDTVKVAKKDNMNPKLCNIVQLSQIPGVSKQTAETIINKYGSLTNLITEYNKLDKDKAIPMLKEIKLANRKVGPVLSKRIYEYLFYL